MKAATKQPRRGNNPKPGPFLQRKRNSAPHEETPFISPKHTERIQPKLNISQPGDKYEQEADRAAYQVMRMTDESVSPPMISRLHSNENSLQRMCPECENEIQRKTANQGHEYLTQGTPVSTKIIAQRKSDNDSNNSSASARTPLVSPVIAANIQALNSGGSPLPRSARSFFEPRFGADFSQVRVHTGVRVAETAKSIDAKAFTAGRNIAFGENQYAPESQVGRQLLAHELTHVVQQSGSQLQPEPLRATGQARQVASSLAHDLETEVSSEKPVEGLSEPGVNSGGSARRGLGQREVISRGPDSRGNSRKVRLDFLSMVQRMLQTNAEAVEAGPRGGEELVQRRPSSQDRKRRRRAKLLQAADARTLLQTSLPFVLEHMTGKHIQQMQRVLDAAVVNPEVEKEVQDLYRQSVLAQSGPLVVRDPKKVRLAERAKKNYVRVTEADKRIRLNYELLLTSEALQPTTDNPDEAAYLETIRRTLAARGVWLRFDSKLVRDPEDPSRHFFDPRTFEAWLSLGSNGDRIPTESGRLTREALLGTTQFGADYYNRVHRGPVQTALDRESNRLFKEIESGINQHEMLAETRRDAFFGVAEISDFLGGAEFPDRSIWDQPHQFVLQAMKLNVGGNVGGSQAFLVTAAILTRNAARLLAEYIGDTSTGAERAVTVLKVAKTAGQVAEVGLAVTGVVGAVRGAAALAGRGGAAGARAAAHASVDEAAEKLVRDYVAKNPEIAGDLANVRWVPGPRGSVAGGVKPGSSSGAGTGWHKW
jgi:hypothetical protein